MNMVLKDFAHQRESEERYRANSEINALISQKFSESKSSYTTPDREIYLEKAVMVCRRNQMTENIRYGDSTLGKSGCAVFCFAAGLITRGENFKIVELAERLTEKGYYFTGRGTWHCLFDHYGLRRASDVQEIFETLERGSIATILVSNKEYNGGIGGNHFINVIGFNPEWRAIIVDDPSMEKPTNIKCDKVFNATKVAWLW